MDPEGFQHVVFVVGVGLVERRGPLPGGGDDLGGIVLAQLDLGEFAHAVLVLLQEFKQRGDGLAVDFLRLEQRAAFVSDAVDAAVFVVTVRVADVMLHVADDVVGPIAEVERPVRADADADGTKIRIRRRDEMLQRFAFQTSAVLADLHAVNALERDDVDIEKTSLELLGEMTAA